MIDVLLLLPISLALVGFVWIVNAGLNVLGHFKRTRYIPDYPLDGGHICSDGQRLFGTSTTLGGLALVCLLWAFLWIGSSAPLWSLVPILVYIGHTLGSFIKRRMRKPDGQFVLGIDHLDSIVVVGVVMAASGVISVAQAALAVLITFIFQPVITWAAYKFGLREQPL